MKRISIRVFAQRYHRGAWPRHLHVKVNAYDDVCDVDAYAEIVVPKCPSDGCDT